MFKTILSTHSGEAEYELDRVLGNPPRRRVDERHMRVEAFEEGRHVAGEGMAGRELEVRVEDISERLNGGIESEPLLVRNAVRLRLGIDRTRILFCASAESTA